MVLIPHQVHGYAEKANLGEGTQVYTVEGKVENATVYIIIISELANLSNAMSWQVGVVIQTVQKDTKYNLKVTDSNQMHDDKQLNRDNPGELISQEQGLSQGSRSFGPWYVWPNKNYEEYGNLIWHIEVMEFHRNFTWFDANMSWKWSDRDINHLHDTTGNYTPKLITRRTLFFTAIAICFAVWRTYGKAANDRVEKGRNI